MNSWPIITQAIASVAYVFVTLIGFLLIRRQIKQVDFSTRRDAYGELYTQQHSITRFFLDHPTLRPFFYDNEPIVDDDAEYKKVMVVAEMIADFSEHIYMQLPSLPPDIQRGWQSYLKYIFDHSPAVRAHFKDKGDWYSFDFVQFLRAKSRGSSSSVTKHHDA